MTTASDRNFHDEELLKRIRELSEKLKPGFVLYEKFNNPEEKIVIHEKTTRWIMRFNETLLLEHDYLYAKLKEFDAI